MNTEPLQISNTFLNSITKNTTISNTETTQPFISILQNIVKKDQISSTASKSRLKSDSSSDKAEDVPELEDKYCSLCGSRIKEDGTCPICITPIFISGNSHAQAQNTAQAAPIQAVSGNRVIASYRNRRG